VTSDGERADGALPPPGRPGIHVLAKPMGPVCQIKCDYCFYLEKRALFGEGEDYRMPDEVLAAYTANYIQSQPTPVVEFVWHGGEPTLRGLDFFRRAITLQREHGGGKEIRNVLQTNAMRLTDEWCAFFKEHGFFIGVSLDGPRDIHDRYRKGRQGEGTFDEVMRGIGLLQKHRVEFNVLACVGRETAYKPLDVYRFFKEIGVTFIQFTPIVEREPDATTSATGLWLSKPAQLTEPEPNTRVTPWTVEPERYGEFLVAIYEEWVRKDVGSVFVMNFEWALNSWMGLGSPICVFARQCGRAVAVEHDGGVYACDHYVYPEYRLGDVRSQRLGEMVDRSVASGFGPHKQASLPRWCRGCEVLEMCWGGCPKHRFATTLDGEPGLHYLCAGYKKFFTHIRKYLRPLAQLVAHRQDPSLIMRAFNGPLLIPLVRDQNGPVMEPS
jgi:serine-type anaerobic sulfatase-maturating enzyme